MNRTASTAGGSLRLGAGEFVASAEMVLPCTELVETLAFFTEVIGFRVAAIFPADGPRTAILKGHSLSIRLEVGGAGDPGAIRLLSTNAQSWGTFIAPNGTKVEVVDADPPLVLPPNKASFAVSKLTGDESWVVGRAGMCYRDLVPDRQGGRFIASHIQIPEGGPVPDYVHFHKVHFQMIYCYKGWVKVVYEDQGEPFIMHEGDCVLQPPTIRHRVLESSDGLEVVEISCPAEHETFADLEMELPTTVTSTGKDYGGQRFVRHQATEAQWLSCTHSTGFEYRDLGLAAGTYELAQVQVLRSCRKDSQYVAASAPVQTELYFMFVLSGTGTLQCAGRDDTPLGAGDSAAVPSPMNLSLTSCSADMQVLQVIVHPKTAAPRSSL
jgi:quercetin dioxygenase-like cupin family protein